MAHRAEPLQDHEAEKQPDGVSHLVGVMLNRDDIPERAGQPNQAEVDQCDSGHKKPGQQQARHVGTNKGQESLEDHHGLSDDSIDCDIGRFIYA